FLARVRRSTLGLAAIAALALAAYRAPLEGLAFALGAAWSLVNLTLLEKLVTALTGPERGAAPAVARAARAIGGMLALFGAGAEPKEEGPQKFANVVTILARAFPNAEWAHFLHHYEVIVFSLLVALLICVVAYFASRNPQMIPGPLQNVFEILVEGLYNFIAGIIGEKHAPRFVPFLGTLGLYIWCMNLFGLIPFMDSLTSNLN